MFNEVRQVAYIHVKRVVAFTTVTYSSWWLRRVAPQDGCEYAVSTAGVNTPWKIIALLTWH